MSSPKLKVGDTFIYTEEMNEAKKKTIYTDKVAYLINKKVTISIVNSNHPHPQYEIKGQKGVYLWNVIDDYLPFDISSRKYKQSIPKTKPRKWYEDLTVKSDDGIEVTKEQIIIPEIEGNLIEGLSIGKATKTYTQLGAALKMHKKHFNK